MKKFLNRFIQEPLEEEMFEISFFLTIKEIIKSHEDVDQIWEKTNIG